MFFCFSFESLSVSINHEFNHFELTEKFKQKYQEDMNRYQENRAGERNPDYRVDEAPIFQTILKEIGNSYNQIGSEQSANVLKFNHEFDMGSQNFSGLTWQKPMGFVFIGVDRQVVPDILHKDNWIVRDKFIFTVNASTFLQNMKEEGMISGISDTQISVFAGVNFTRVYTYTHFEKSYVDGIVSDYTKLFLSFLMFKRDLLLKMKPGEVVSKQDYMTFSAGGSVKSPTYYGFSAAVGALVQANLMAKVVVHRPSLKDQETKDELLRISLNKEKGLSGSVAASVQADIYNFLQLTLLKFDFTYSYTDESYMALTLYEKNKKDFLSNSKLGIEIQKILLFIPPNKDHLKDNIISWEERMQQDINAQYLVLIFGGFYKSNTTMRDFYIGGQRSRFFVNYSRSVSYIENIISKVVNILITKLLNFSLFSTSHVARWEKYSEIQYQSTPKIEKQFVEGRPNDEQRVDAEEMFSITIRKTYFAQGTRGLYGIPFKNYAISYMSKFTSLNPKIIRYVQDEVLYGPLTIKTNIVFMKKGFEYLNNISVKEAASGIKDVCNRQPDSKQSVCKELLIQKIGDYRDEYDKTKLIPFYKVKKFIEILRLYAYDLKDFENFFGAKNVFYSGYFAAKHKKGYFETYFHGGDFQGVGVIDNYVRRENGNTTIAIPYWEEDIPTF